MAYTTLYTLYPTGRVRTRCVHQVYTAKTPACTATHQREIGRLYTKYMVYTALSEIPTMRG
jgi:hypothetical protein